MRKKLFVTVIIVILLCLVACQDSSENMAKKLKEVGEDLQNLGPNTELSDEEIVTQAIELTKSLLAQTKDVLTDSDFYYKNSEKHDEFVSVLKLYSDLAAKYSNNPAAWSAVRSYMRYQTLEDFPDVLNLDPSTDDSLGPVLSKVIDNTSETGVSNLITAIKTLYSDGGDDIIKGIQDGFELKTPTIKGTSNNSVSYTYKKGTSWSAKSLNISGVSKYSSDIIDVTYGHSKGSENFTVSGSPFSESTSFTVKNAVSQTTSFTVTYTIKDKYKNVFRWDDKKPGLSRTITMKINYDSGTGGGGDGKTSVSVTGNMKYNESSVANNSEIVCVGIEQVLLNITSTPSSDVLLSVTVDENVIATDIKPTLDSGVYKFQTVDTGIKKPGKYTIKYEVKPDPEGEYSSSHKTSGSKTLTVTLLDPIEVAKEELVNELTPVGVSLVASLYLEAGNYNFQNKKLSDCKSNDPNFYQLIVEKFGSEYDSNVLYLYTDLFPSLYFNEILYTISDLVEILSLNNSQSKKLITDSINFPSLFDNNGVLLTQEQPLALKEIVNFSSAISYIDDSFDSSYYKGLSAINNLKTKFGNDNGQKYINTIVKLLNAYGCLNEPIEIFANPEVVEKLNWLLTCVKAAISYEYDLCTYKEIEESGKIVTKFVFSPCPRISSLLSTLKASLGEEIVDEYLSDIPEYSTDIETIISNAVTKYTKAMDYERRIEK